MQFRRSCSLLLWVFLLALPQVARGDEKPRGEFGDTVEVSEVLLDVLVTDSQGNVVLGLGPEDFVVEEEGEPVDVTGVSFYSNRFLLRDGEPEEVQHPAANEVPADRTFIFFFHDQRRAGLEFSGLVAEQLQAGRESRRWVEEEMLPGDWVAVVSYDVRLQVHEDFTRDREALLHAIEAATTGKEGDAIWPSRRQNLADDQPSLVRLLPEGKALGKATRTIYEGVEEVAEATRGIVGRKTLLLFTIGFGRLRSGIGTTEPDPRYYPELEQALNDNNIAVYPIDLTPRRLDHAQSAFLSTLASDTGGYYYTQFVNYLTPLKEIADEANGYYLLSYEAEHPAGESGYRDVKVKTRNPSFNVRAREGYRYGV